MEEGLSADGIHNRVSETLISFSAGVTTGMFAKETKILFQGDSLTDGGRGRNDDLNHILGHGYVYLIASRLTADRPDLNLHFHNRGCSGNTVLDLHARWKEDALDMIPDVISILIGVNDVCAELYGNVGVAMSKYEAAYRLILSATLAASPNVKLVLCEPFILPVGQLKARWPEHRAKMDRCRGVIERLSIEFNAVLVRSQDLFDAASADSSPEYWMWDGIHPMPAGHELLARAWLAATCPELPEVQRGARS
jgi:lysophospholipase L1-like esterase